MHTNHKNHANDNDHKSSENENGTESREAREGKSASAQSGRAVFTGSNWGVRCAPVWRQFGLCQCERQLFPTCIGLWGLWGTCQSVISPRVVNTDPDMLCQPESSSVNGYMVFGVCPMPWLLFIYLFIYLYFFGWPIIGGVWKKT
jgi:hypothetical protein